MKKILPILGVIAILSILILGGYNYLSNYQKSNNPASLLTQQLPSKDGCPPGQSKREMPSMCITDPQLNPNLTSTPNENMPKKDISTSINDDRSFVQSMIPHHQEAIDASKLIVAQSTSQDIKDFANQVIIDQTKEVEIMKTWILTLTKSEYKADGLYMPTMLSLRDKTAFDLDKAYIQSMIEYHNRAIEMGKKISTITKSQDILNLANNMISNQTKEVQKLEGWLKNKFNT
jgi:uncharacterized protein (DUF305 family)